MSVSKFTPAPTNAATLSPGEARAVFRRNGYYGTTSGFCVGYTQANLTMLPSSLADDFEDLCCKNYGCFPLLYRSKPGEVGAPPLAKDSNIKLDAPRYVIYSNGQVVEDMQDLDGFSHLWNDIVCFYIGCSFTFEHILIENGIELANLKEGKNCSMYFTNIMLEDSGPFTGIQMAVSMRPIPKSLLYAAIEITSHYPDHHGAPIHIGDPLRIGISDISNPEQGDGQVKLDKESVFVFWACGVSNRSAIAAAKPKIAFSHYPGSMFIADLKAERKISKKTFEVVQLSRPEAPYFASIIGSKTVAILSRLEKLLVEDPGRRGVAHLLVESDLLKAVLSLSHAKRVAITTGFPANINLLEKQETDGISGALSICGALQVLGKEVSLILDESTEAIFEKCVDKMASLRALKSLVPILTFKKAKKLMEDASNDDPAFDCLVAIERAGRSIDGTYRSMSKNNISEFVDPIDDLFVYASSNQLVSTIGIGDGGNELGMGKVREKIAKNITFGDIIACETAADFLIAAGVSDWGGYAVAIGLHAVSQCPIHWRYARHAINSETPPQFQLSDFLPSNEQVISLLEFMNDSLGIMDGITKGKGSIDGIPVSTVLEKVQEMKDLAIGMD